MFRVDEVGNQLDLVGVHLKWRLIGASVDVKDWGEPTASDRSTVAELEKYAQKSPQTTAPDLQA